MITTHPSLHIYGKAGNKGVGPCYIETYWWCKPNCFPLVEDLSGKSNKCLTLHNISSSHKMWWAQLYCAMIHGRVQGLYKDHLFYFQIVHQSCSNDLYNMAMGAVSKITAVVAYRETTLFPYTSVSLNMVIFLKIHTLRFHYKWILSYWLFPTYFPLWKPTILRRREEVMVGILGSSGI